MLRAFFAFVLPAVAYSCSCAPSGPPCEAAWKQSAVFLGTVKDLKRDMSPPLTDDFESAAYRTHATLEVNEAFLGMEGIGKEVDIRTGLGGGDCGYPLRVDQVYVVYVFKTKSGLLTTSICSRTRPVENAAEDLTYLRSLKRGSSAGYIYGFVADGQAQAHFDQDLGRWVSQGIAGATVKLTGEGKPFQRTTLEDGAFRFDDLGPGKYQINVAKTGYSPGNNSRPLELHAGGCLFVAGQLVVDRRIIGKVTAADGAPAVGVPIEIVPVRPSQQFPLPFAAATAVTAADGSYELTNLRPGEYYLGISLAHSPSKQTPYTRYFYPGTEDPSRAGIVIVKEAPGMDSFNFAIPKPRHERTIEGFVQWPDGRPAAQVAIMIEDPRWPWQNSTVSTNTDAAGHFSMNVLDHTAYRIHAILMARSLNECDAVEPFPLLPAVDYSKPIHLVLTRKGHTAAEMNGKGLDSWRAGHGLK